MTSAPTERLLHLASRIKRHVHAASAPRTPPLEAESADVVDVFIDLLFPNGLDGAGRRSAHDLLDSNVDHHTVRRLLGQTDQNVSPSPFSVQATDADVAEVQVGGVRLVLDTADASVSRAILDSGEWEPHVDRVLRDVLRPGHTFVDVGANVGYHSVVATEIVGASGTVIAIEPNPDNARLIAATIERNEMSNLRLVPLALSDRAGFSVFRHAIGTNGGFADAHSDVVLEPNTTIVPTVRLDDLDIGRVDVIKLDIEGAEPLALRGARQTIEHHRPTLIFEFSVEMTQRISGVDAAEFLDDVVSDGYRLSVIDKPSGELMPIESVEALMTGWGSLTRIEDLVAHPSPLGPNTH